jgi:hypothetical protein
MGTNCASLLADLFLHDYQGLLKNKDRKLFATDEGEVDDWKSEVIAFVVEFCF